MQGGFALTLAPAWATSSSAAVAFELPAFGFAPAFFAFFGATFACSGDSPSLRCPPGALGGPGRFSPRAIAWIRAFTQSTSDG